jgi:hypothetical protein
MKSFFFWMLIRKDISPTDRKNMMNSPKQREAFMSMANCGLTNDLTDVHLEQVPNTHVRESKQIDFALVTDGIRPCIKAIGLLDESILKSDHRELFLDLDLLLLFGASLERLERPQFRNLKFDDPQISDSYHKLLHKQFGCHNIYDRVKKFCKRGKVED